jgi:hypothetical protein
LWQYEEGRPLVFNHIPKTAGTSLTEALLAALQPDRHTHVLDGVVLGDYDHLATMRRAARTMIVVDPGQLDRNLQFVTGHISPSTTMGRFPEAPHITFLREPRTRILSLWLYSRSRPLRERRYWGRYGERIGMGDRELGDYLDNPGAALGVDNMITRFLLWPHPLIASDDFIHAQHDAVLLEHARTRLAEFAYVGVVEDPDMAARLAGFLGVPLSVPRRKEGSPFSGRDRLDVEGSVDMASDLLEHRSRLDRQLWEDVVRRTLPDAVPAELATRTLGGAVARYARLASEPPARQKGRLARGLVRRARALRRQSRES